MKRNTVLPSILMILLCVGILCAGIYAARPNSNQITGSITINAANPAVDIVAWTEDWEGNQTSTPQEVEGLRTGNHTFSFANGLTLDFSSASSASEVKPAYIKFEVTNMSSKELGVYFSTKTMAGEATKADIFTTAPMVNSAAIDATSLIFYSHIGGASGDESVTTDTATLSLEFKPNSLIEDATPITFNNYYINIEEYNPNITTETITSAQINEVDGFVKLSTTISDDGGASALSAVSLSETSTPRTGITSTTGFTGLTNETLDDDLWVVVPNGVETIGGGSSTSGAFYNCTALSKISIPNSITSILAYGFNGCINLLNITLPNGSTTMGQYAFNKCTNLKNVVISKGLTTIPNRAFWECKNIESVRLSNTVTQIGTYSFHGTAKIKFVVDVENATFSSDSQGGLYSKDKKTLFIGAGIEMFQIPSGVTTINGKAFSEGVNLKSVVIPNSVNIIGNDVFSGCKNLTSVIIPDSVTSIGEKLFENCENLQTVTISNGITTISASAFSGCESLKSVDIPHGVTTINSSAFSGCASLENVTIPSTTTKIDKAFSYCSNVKFSVDAENTTYSSDSQGGLYSKYGTSLYCGSGVEEFIIPNSVTTIETYSFSGRTNLLKIAIPNSVSSINGFAFVDCANLVSVTIANTVSTIEMNGFYGCINLETINIPQVLTSIGSNAFGYCAKIKFTVDSQNTKFSSDSQGALYNKDKTTLICGSGVEEFEVPSTVTTINSTTFSGFTQLVNVVIPNSLTKLSGGTFNGCTNLESVTIPSSITSIGFNILNNCPSLILVKYLGTAESFVGISGAPYVYKNCVVTCTNGIVNKDGTITPA